MVTNMRPPIFVRTLSEEEREALEEGLRSSERLLGAYELAERVCKVFGCAHEEHLSIPQEVA
jgi:hypothetical protein